NHFTYTKRDVSNDMAEMVEFDCGAGEIAEIAPERSAFMMALMNIAQAGLVIDYGYTMPGPGETLQALHKHGTVDALSHIGEADVTAHVDFAALCRVIEENGGRA